MNEARKQFQTELTRARRIALCLNKAIRLDDKEKIKHWQLIAWKYYGMSDNEIKWETKNTH